MTTLTDSEHAEATVRALEQAYVAYMSALTATITLGNNAMPALLKALNHNHANPIAKALGYLMDSPAADAAIPPLLEWVIGQWPIYPDASEALVRAGTRALPHVLARIALSAEQGDDEAVRNLLQVAMRLPESTRGEVIGTLRELLQDPHHHIREAAADTVRALEFPHIRPLLPVLWQLAQKDAEAAVRTAAWETLTRLGQE